MLKKYHLPYQKAKKIILVEEKASFPDKNAQQTGNRG